jgi:uncharacterized membrane protein YdjX (TVP38/TMEM64 family)
MSIFKSLTSQGIIRIISGVTAVALLIFLGLFYRTSLSQLFSASPLLFILLVIVSETLFIPRIAVLLASGLFFNPLFGALLTITGDLTAAIIMFFLGSLSFAPALKNTLLKNSYIKRFNHLLRGKNTIFTIALLRIAPFSHYSSVSLLSGAAGLSFKYYIVGTMAGLIPTALIYPLMAKHTMNMHLWTTVLFGLILLIIIVTALTLLKWNNKNENN